MAFSALFQCEKLFSNYISGEFGDCIFQSWGSRRVSIVYLITSPVQHLNFRFDGTFSVGFVAENVKVSGIKDKVPVILENGSIQTIIPFFIRFISKSLIKDYSPDSTIIQKNLKKFIKTSKELLVKNYKIFEKSVNEQYEKCPAADYGKELLIYEYDLACKIFKEPTPEQIYSIHLFLQSYSKKFGRDALFSSSSGGGPYFIRRPEDVKLAEDVGKVISSLSQNDEGRSKNIQNQSDPNFSLFHKVLEKASLLNWQDLRDNPFTLLVGKYIKVDLIPTIDSLISFCRRLGVSGDLKNLDAPTCQSGLRLDKYDNKMPQYPVLETTDDSLVGRVEFDEMALSIDQATTVDVDDAISLQKVGDDYWLHIHVADPSRLFNLGSPIDLVARSRVSSLYLPTNSYFMLPDSATKLASLDANNLVNKSITFSAKIAGDGSILDYQVNLGLLKSLRRMTYDEADEILNSSRPNNNPLKMLLEGLGKVTGLHQKNRLINSPSSALGIPRPRVKVLATESDQKYWFEIENAPGQGKVSHTIVSEAMIIAGRVAAQFCYDRKIAVPYRYHLDPTKIHGDPFVSCLNTILRGDFGEQSPLYHKLMLLKYIQPSAVDITPRDHWSMNLKMYSKSTSPLRRYLDLILHHQIHSSIRNQPHNEEVITKLLPPVYRHEQYLAKLERFSTRYWTLRYIHSLLRTGPLKVTGFILDYCSRGNPIFFIENFAIRQPCELPGFSALKKGVPTELWIIDVDPLRQTMRLSFMK